MTVINAFNPLFVLTHMPEFMADFRRSSNAITEGKKAAGRPRKYRQSGGQDQIAPLSDFPKTKRARIDLEPRQYNTYSRAGAK